MVVAYRFADIELVDLDAVYFVSLPTVLIHHD
jgi:hypothetical protein